MRLIRLSQSQILPQKKCHNHRDSQRKAVLLMLFQNWTSCHYRKTTHLWLRHSPKQLLLRLVFMTGQCANTCNGISKESTLSLSVSQKKLFHLIYGYFLPTHFADTCAAALCVAEHIGIPLDEACRAIEKNWVPPEELRCSASTGTS
jgi:hypothetical protein